MNKEEEIVANGDASRNPPIMSPGTQQVQEPLQV